MRYFFWKLRREILRIQEQILGIVAEIYEPFLQKKYDRNRSKKLQWNEGSITSKEKIAIFLIFQPNGLLASSLWTCEYLISKGYTPLIISNARISEKDLERLKKICWRVVVRPNFGYDFGGYRDAIWLLTQWKVQPECLIILNDSIWFPIHSMENLIEKMEKSPADFVGALQLDPLKKSTNGGKKYRPFFGSFFLLIKRNALRHPAFVKFWDEYKITSNKYKTIRRGERQLSHSMFDANISSCAIYTHQKLNNYLSGLSPKDLHNALDGLVSRQVDLNKRLIDCKAQFMPTSEWKKNALELALLVTKKQNFLFSAPTIAIRNFNVPYIKKSHQNGNLEALKLIANEVKDFSVPPLKDCVRDEINSLIQSKS